MPVAAGPGELRDKERESKKMWAHATNVGGWTGSHRAFPRTTGYRTRARNRLNVSGVMRR